MSRYKDADEILFELDNLQSSNNLPQEWSSFDVSRSHDVGGFPCLSVNAKGSQIPSPIEDVIDAAARVAGKTKTNISLDLRNCSFGVPAFRPLRLESHYAKIEPVYRPSFFERFRPTCRSEILSLLGVIVVVCFILWSLLS
jgi:hypothetical protein